MPAAPFSAFERILLQSRSPVDSAVLLLLAWVLAHRQHVSEGQRRRRLAQVSADFRHGHTLSPVMQIAREANLDAIQLAAEIVRAKCSAKRCLGILHQAIAVATDDGELSLANHYILRFLADLLSVAPMTFTALFLQLTGQALKAPDDPSQERYWRRLDPAKYYAKYYAHKAEEEARAQRERAESDAAKAREKRQQEQAKAQEREEQRRREEQQRRDEEQARRRSSHQSRDHRRQEQSRPAPDRTTRALAVLGLTPGVSKQEVRQAYRRLAQSNHPDRFYAASEHQVALASARFQRIKSAYDYLMQTL
ncbi:J domain-containing protein [Halomonas dongshanensis]|uniref:DnaJ domain-containing protein n=1 Tax=Halomonas dongshanensis TaxID=2890835 RepID=A0ABT2EDD9_9GAMM|nr:DnaJ domain-containing protein [Halomonas dongshanensis]MCS2609591.1 DnaJ domain-containing protein [Halomonas dongshanensis]